MGPPVKNWCCRSGGRVPEAACARLPRIIYRLEFQPAPDFSRRPAPRPRDDLKISLALGTPRRASSPLRSPSPSQQRWL